MSLIVVHGDDDIKLSAKGLDKYRVGRYRTAYFDPLGGSLFNSRDNALPLLGSEQTVFRSVRVQPGHTHSGMLNTQQLHAVFRQPDRSVNALL